MLFSHHYLLCLAAGASLSVAIAASGSGLLVRDVENAVSGALVADIGAGTSAEQLQSLSSGTKLHRRTVGDEQKRRGGGKRTRQKSVIAASEGTSQPSRRRKQSKTSAVAKENSESPDHQRFMQACTQMTQQQREQQQMTHSRNAKDYHRHVENALKNMDDLLKHVQLTPVHTPVHYQRRDTYLDPLKRARARFAEETHKVDELMQPVQNQPFEAFGSVAACVANEHRRVRLGKSSRNTNDLLGRFYGLYSGYSGEPNPHPGIEPIHVQPSEWINYD